jgi:HEAT repeat protein
LGDGRWYVVRNAAELIGEMRATEAEQALAWLVNHPDARVRRSVTTALAKLDTPGARAALREAIRDTSPDVRMNALLCLSNGNKQRVAAEIIRALPDERDPDSQRTLMTILARLGTPEALQYVLDAAEPEKSFFKKKPTPARIAAVSALAETTDPTALTTIRALTKDKEPEVRVAAARALPAAEALAATMTPPDASWSNPTPDQSGEAAA